MADKTGFEQLPKRFLTADSLHAFAGSKTSAMNTAIEIGAKLVDAVNRVAAALEHDKGFEHRVHCSDCGSRTWEPPDAAGDIWCSACGTKKPAKEGGDDDK